MKATLRKDIDKDSLIPAFCISTGEHLTINVYGKEFEVAQPDMLDDEELNVLIKYQGDFYLCSSIDLDFINEPEPALSLYRVDYTSWHGINTYLIKADHCPNEAEVIEHFDIDYDYKEDREEYIEIKLYDDIDVLKSSETAK